MLDGGIEERQEADDLGPNAAREQALQEAQRLLDANCKTTLRLIEQRVEQINDSTKPLKEVLKGAWFTPFRKFRKFISESEQAVSPDRGTSPKRIWNKVRDFDWSDVKAAMRQTSGGTRVTTAETNDYLARIEQHYGTIETVIQTVAARLLEHGIRSEQDYVVGNKLELRDNWSDKHSERKSLAMREFLKTVDVVFTTNKRGTQEVSFKGLGKSKLIVCVPVDKVNGEYLATKVYDALERRFWEWRDIGFPEDISDEAQKIIAFLAQAPGRKIRAFLGKKKGQDGIDFTGPVEIDGAGREAVPAPPVTLTPALMKELWDSRMINHGVQATRSLRGYIEFTIDRSLAKPERDQKYLMGQR